MSEPKTSRELAEQIDKFLIENCTGSDDHDADNCSKCAGMREDLHRIVAQREQEARDKALQEAGDWFLNFCDRAGLKIEESSIRRTLFLWDLYT